MRHPKSFALTAFYALRLPSYITSTNLHAVYYRSSTGAVSIVAGIYGNAGYTNHLVGQATALQIHTPHGVIALPGREGSGFIFTELHYGTLRHVDKMGIMRTIYSGSQQPCQMAWLGDPSQGTFIVAEHSGRARLFSTIVRSTSRSSSQTRTPSRSPDVSPPPTSSASPAPPSPSGSTSPSVPPKTSPESSAVAVARDAAASAAAAAVRAERLERKAAAQERIAEERKLEEPSPLPQPSSTPVPTSSPGVLCQGADDVEADAKARNNLDLAAERALLRSKLRKSPLILAAAKQRLANAKATEATLQAGINAANARVTAAASARKALDAERMRLLATQKDVMARLASYSSSADTDELERQDLSQRLRAAKEAAALRSVELAAVDTGSDDIIYALNRQIADAQSEKTRLSFAIGAAEDQAARDKVLLKEAEDGAAAASAALRTNPLQVPPLSCPYTTYNLLSTSSSLNRARLQSCFRDSNLLLTPRRLFNAPVKDIPLRLRTRRHCLPGLTEIDALLMTL